MIVIQITDVAKVRLLLEVSESKTFQGVVIQHTTVDLLITGIKIGPDIYPNACMCAHLQTLRGIRNGFQSLEFHCKLFLIPDGCY